MPTIPETLAIAVQHHQAGRLQAAEQLYRQILAADPNQVDAWHLLGVLQAQLGRPAAGVDCLRRALALRPDWVDALYNLGRALAEQGKLDEAIACYRRAVELKPDHAEACSNLGSALSDQGRCDEAVECCRRAMKLKPDSPGEHNNLGIALSSQGKLDEAAVCYRRALELKPDYAEAHNNLGNVRKDEGKLDEAVACYRRALDLKPAYVGAHNNLGAALQTLGKFDEAVACYRRALAAKPDHAKAHNNLGTALQTCGKLDEAVACYRRALESQPDFAAAHSNLLCTLQYRAGVKLSELAAAHREYDRLHAAPLQTAWRTHENLRHRAPSAGSSRRLRLGFVSADLGRHPVGYFLVRCLENLDPDQCETVCYSDRVLKDDLTTRFQAAATLWRDAIGLSDERLAEAIRADRIDVLFDLAGHMAGNRLLVFARKPAPIQVTWAGYVGTTGLAAMDYILADRCEIPPQSEAFYCERVLRMPDGYVCYEPPDYAPPVSPLPAAEKGLVTLAGFHNPAKITPEVVEVWSRVLHRVPGARLVLKYRGMDDPLVSRRLADLFSGRGVDPARLEFLGYSPHGETLAEYRRVDVALDTFPYNGGLTTCEALWMGVPVVTCPGETFASRHSLSHLSNVGLTETIARDLDEYVEIAAALAGDLPRLSALRAGLRERMAASPLCDGKRFAANFAGILRGVWREWCETR